MEEEVWGGHSVEMAATEAQRARGGMVVMVERVVDMEREEVEVVGMEAMEDEVEVEAMGAAEAVETAPEYCTEMI